MTGRRAADPTAALATYLGGTSVNDLALGIYRPKLPPEGELPAPMPDAYVVVSQMGGGVLFDGGTLPLRDPRIEFRCYGPSELDAMDLGREVALVLHELRQRVLAETSAPGAKQVRLLWARIEAGPISLIDPDTDWPYALVSAQVAHTEYGL